jgi:hypothetical protein
MPAAMRDDDGKIRLLIRRYRCENSLERSDCRRKSGTTATLYRIVASGPPPDIAK